MDKRESITACIREQSLVPLFFHADPQVCVSVLTALYDAGVRVVEFTNRGKEALENFKVMKSSAKNMEGLFLGIGTIKNENAADAFINAEADFLVSPMLAEDVFDVAYNSKTLWIPGCMTPTEIGKAESFGITTVKLFPGNVLGPGYVTAIRDLFPDMTFMATGGVDTSEKNLTEWFKSGVAAVGMGSKLITDASVKSGDFDTIRTEAAKALASIKTIKGDL